MRASGTGDAALERLAEHVYPELRAMAAQMMQRILVDAARALSSQKRGWHGAQNEPR